MATEGKPRITLLGGFAAEKGGTAVPDPAWRLRKAKELVKLLALADGHRLHREQAMDELWPDRDPAAAANNLNQAVHAARRALGAGAITLLDGVLRLDAELDVEAFEHAAAEARRERSGTACRRALSLYGGELLPENRYDDWASLERERLADLHAELRRLLAELGERPAGPSPTLRPLPVETSTFVGREHELGELAALLAHTRLLTLTGTGGVGKTRLALALARHQAAYADGVLFVELDALDEGGLVPGAVAEGLDLRALRGGAVVDALVAELEPLEFLLVLDNCEHLIGAAATLADSLLRGAPRLTVLATSRQPLRVPGEVLFRVPSLGIPDPEREDDPEALLRYQAVRLFVQRAGAVAPGFALDGETAPAVARICHRLDGLPLALELAAARVDALSPAALAGRLDDRFRLLRAGSRTAPTRQQTLEATLDWSHELLSAAERTLLRRLASFSGSFGLEAAEEVCAGDGLEAAQVALLLAELVEKSLVTSEDRGGSRRYRLLETIRSYSATRLAESGERSVVAARHAAWLMKFVERLDQQLTGLESEQGNLRAALETLLETEPHEALRLTAAVWPFWLRRIELSEARHWLGETLERVPDDSPERIKALLGHAAIEFRSGDAGYGLPKVEEALALARRLGDPALEWLTLHFRAAVEIADDDGPSAASFYEPALALAREHGLAAPEAVSAYSLGAAAWVGGDVAEAERLCEESFALFGALTDSEDSVPALVNVAEMIHSNPDAPGVRIAFEETLQPFADISCRVAAGYVLLNWANVVRSADDDRRARALLEEGLALFERIRSDQGRADAWARLANLELSSGRLDEAAELFEQARRVRERLGDRRGVALALVGLGQVATRREDHERAAELLQEALVTFRRAGDRWGLVSTLWRAADLELARHRPAAAEEKLEEALAVVGETRRVRWQAVTCVNLAELALQRGDEARARALLERALEGFETRGDARWAEHVRTRLSAANPAQIGR
ncbi:MAG TPA: tetratricopeptide repeat protein [Gaiellaceae bacterium]|nr:tetratricopeptide repeat protein [Gaiellaceae bacterium]